MSQSRKSAGQGERTTMPVEETPNLLAGQSGSRRAASPIGWRRVAEWALILVWAMYVGRGYLDFNPQAVPTGGEFGEHAVSPWVWTLLPECGDCIFWNGYANGGWPAFAELLAPVVHPLVAIPVVIAGGVNGLKIALVLSLAMAGLAQWWIARALGLGWLARMWSAVMAVVGGHLAARMAGGIYSVVLATAAVSLVIGPAIELATTGRRRSAVWLGLALAGAVVSSQGYMQLGLLMALAPAALIFLLEWRGGRLRWRRVTKGFVLAGALGLFLSAAHWVPVLHFWPEFVKDIDPNFGSVQALEYAPLNLVIRDYVYFTTSVLSKSAVPYLYGNYIGWVPILLALVALRLIPRPSPRSLSFFLVAIVLVFLSSSAVTFRLLARIAPAQMHSVRNPALIAGLAVPLILGLAAWGLDLLTRLRWPRFALEFAGGADGAAARFGLLWLILLPLMVLNISAAYQFGHGWLKSSTIPESERKLVESLRTDSAQWVSTPFGQHYWLPYALQSGLKVNTLIRPWHWRDRPLPMAYLESSRKPLESARPEFFRNIEQFFVVERPENEYAFVETGQGLIPCSARSRGGYIDVDCATDVAGTLIVRENQWTGWQATRDGVPVKIIEGPILSVEALAGSHQYAFRYRPWDAPVGLGITLVGVLLAVWFYFWKPKTSYLE